ncbi:MAG: S41 family peptidase [Mobilicoccus sp.]|nr:S41 family peptidase [Mobilicoccus sp.]
MTDGYLRDPHLHADNLVFVADDDVWTVPTSGGRASRLTADRQPCRHPFFSPDGTRIAYTSLREDHWEVFVLELATGQATRLTWWGRHTTRVRGWVDDGHVLVASDHREPFSQRRRLFSVALDGTEERLEYGHAMSLATSSSGAEALTTPNHRDHAMWKRYRGGTAPHLWLRGAADQPWTRVLPDEHAGFWSPTWSGDRLAFAGDLGARFPDRADEQGQVWSVDATGGDLQVHTAHTGEDGYVRDLAGDGERLVYHARGALYVMDSLDAQPRRVEVDLGPLATPTRWITAEDRLLAVRPDAGGNASLLDWHGQAWWLAHRGGPARLLLGHDGMRVREPRFVGTDRVLAVGDEGGADALLLAPLDGSAEPTTLAQGQLGRVLHLMPSPDGEAAAVISHDNSVRLVDLHSGEVTDLTRCEHGEPVSPVFSPDGRYLLWSEPISSEGAHRLMSYDRRASQGQSALRALTSGAFSDTEPTFTRDGRHIVFLSARTLDPHYSGFGFDLAFTDVTRPWLAPLAATDPSPFGPSVEGWRLAAPAEDAAKAGSDAAGDESATVPAVTSPALDADSFEDRIAPFPVASGTFAGLRAGDKDGVLWIRRVPRGELGSRRDGVTDTPRDTLERFDLRTRTVTELADVDSYEISGDGRLVVLRDERDVVVRPSTHKVEDDADDVVTVDLSRLRREVDLRTLWQAMFDDNGRIMAEQFWRDDMDGVDWAGVLARYRPLMARVATQSDVIDVLWETVGELNTSHAYVDGAMPATEQSVAQLGIDVERDADGALVIVAILPGESSAPEARSPMRAAGVDARPGDRIVAVDGRSVAGVPLGRLLVGRAGKAVEVTLERDGVRRRVAVTPIADEEALRYQAWVASRREYVRERSGGRLGYLHVPDMVSNGWAQFHRGLDEATQAEGLVADMRYNRGGHTSQLVIERLARRVIAWDEVRHGSQATYPAQGRRGPIVFLSNRWSGSDGDIVNAAAQSYGLGPVIGERTWGGVVGIDGRFDLVDGTGVTQPKYAFYFERHGWGVEGHGVDPDIEVVFCPTDAEGELDADPQLDRAIEELLASLADTPALTSPPLPAPRVQ